MSLNTERVTDENSYSRRQASHLPDDWRQKKCRGCWINDRSRSTSPRSNSPPRSRRRTLDFDAEAVHDPRFDPSPVSSPEEAVPSRPLRANAAMTPLSLMATRAKHSPQVIYDPLTTSVMSGWLATCQESHRNHCVRSPEPADSIDGRPLWLYDLDNECLVVDNGVKQYAALSYVWGQVRILQTVSANLRAFSRPHGLVAAALPYTIRDASWLATSIDTKYLWVDCLCLVQDDAETKKAQIG
jgi:Heterokaryon incompatibility protein (HET)